MDNLNLISNFAEFKELKNIDKSTMIGVLEDVFRHTLSKIYETDDNFDVIINPEKGDLEIWRSRVVVEDGTVENAQMQIAVSEAKEIDPTYEIGDEVAEPGAARIVRSAVRCSRCARTSHRASSTWKRPTSTRNTPTRWAKSSRARSTRSGKRRC